MATAGHDNKKQHSSMPGPRARAGRNNAQTASALYNVTRELRHMHARSLPRQRRPANGRPRAAQACCGCAPAAAFLPRAAQSPSPDAPWSRAPAANQPWCWRRTHASPAAQHPKERCAYARLRLPCPLPPCLRPTAAPARTPRRAVACGRTCGGLPCPTPLRRAAARARRRAPARSRRRRTRGPHGARRRRAAARRPWAQAARNRSRRPAAQAAGCETGRSRAPHADATHTAAAVEGKRCAVVGPTSVRASESRSCPNASSLYVAIVRGITSPDTFPGMPTSPAHGL